jgi:hypothetical protein
MREESLVRLMIMAGMEGSQTALVLSIVTLIVLEIHIWGTRFRLRPTSLSMFGVKS